jgi:tritrans,polycis-undecaprenyl-diphosphate synthase [geranylgeranyl-diphosphate specific]
VILYPVYRLYEWFLERQVKAKPIPQHIAVIMDGNRRLARKLGSPPWVGHRLGAQKLEEFLEWCVQLGIKTVTTYAFSTENFSRPKEEVEKLFDIFEEYFYKVAEDERIHRNRVRIKAIGKVERFPERVQKAIAYAEEKTKHYDNLILNVAVAYGGRQEIVDAFKKMAEKIERGEMSSDEISEATIAQHLYTNGTPDPDLIIRTSGEERISGFLLWQSAYAELYFCETYWPGFRKIDFLRALRTYQQRQRRFGR